MAGKRDKNRDIQAAGVNWLDQLAQELNVPFAPAGWYTITQIAKRIGRGDPYTRRLMQQKDIPCKQFKCKTSDGKVILSNHYKL